MNDRVTLLAGDCLDLLDTLEENSVDAVVTDPPYHLHSIVKRFAKTGRTESTRSKSGPHQRTARGFMGRTWDGGDIAWREELWAKVLRVLKPGGFCCAFSATRTYHRMATAMENAGFVIQDQLDWLYGTGFPKSKDIAKAIDKALGAEGEYGAPRSEAHAGWIERGSRLRGEGGAEGWQRPWMDDPDAVEKAAREYIPATDEAREWLGWGTALKPAHEPIVLAQKPLSERTIAANVLRWGTGGLNIAGCLVGERERPKITDPKRTSRTYGAIDSPGGKLLPPGRWPANVVHDGSEDVEREFAAFAAPGQQGAVAPDMAKSTGNSLGEFKHNSFAMPRGDVGSPSRFFYSAKADDGDRMGSNHPTVKPVDLMAWLVRLTTPVGGVVLDPFAGTGTTLAVASGMGRDSIGIDLDARNAELAVQRVGPLLLTVEHHREGSGV